MMKSLKQVAFITIVIANLPMLYSCVPIEPGSTELIGVGGYVAEIDEPSARGQLTRVSPPGMDIAWRFAISPDGGSIVFSGKQAGSNEPYQLYKISVSGGAPVKITSGGDQDAWDPSFTSDGQFIVFRTGTSFWKVRADGSGARVKIPGSGLNRDYFPRISSQNRIVFVTYDNSQNKYLLWTVGINGTELTQIKEGNFPVWSPDGKTIACLLRADKIS